MTASLAGLEDALEPGDAAEVERRAAPGIETLYAVAYSFGGIPLVYMGDEIAMRNDADWDADPAHADDNRWLHRPRDGLGGGRTAARPRHRRSSAASTRCAGWARCGVRTKAFRSDADHDGDPQSTTRTCWPTCASTRGPLRCWRWRTSATTSRAWPSRVLGPHGFSAPLHLHSSAGGSSPATGAIHLPAWGFLWVTELRLTGFVRRHRAGRPRGGSPRRSAGRAAWAGRGPCPGPAAARRRARPAPWPGHRRRGPSGPAGRGCTSVGIRRAAQRLAAVGLGEDGEHLPHHARPG